MPGFTALPGRGWEGPGTDSSLLVTGAHWTHHWGGLSQSRQIQCRRHLPIPSRVSSVEGCYPLPGPTSPPARGLLHPFQPPEVRGHLSTCSCGYCSVPGLELSKARAPEKTEFSALPSGKPQSRGDRTRPKHSHLQNQAWGSGRGEVSP